MKKTVFLALTILFATYTFAQEEKEEKKSNKFSIIIKPKIGFGELKMDDYGSFNGFYSAFEFLVASKLSEKYHLEYGFGLSEYKANTNAQPNIGAVKNNNVFIPVNLMRSINLNSNNSIQIGIGLYGNYLYKSEIEGLIDDKNIDFNVGYNVQVGAEFKIANQTSFRVLLESQNDLTTLKENNVEFKQINTSAISLGFIHNF